MKIYFVRHGESEANVLQVISNRPGIHGLTEKGRLQAEMLAQTLCYAKPRAIFASPLLRAVQTGEILSSACGVPYEITDALREFDCGIAEGRSDDAAWEMHCAVMREWFERGNYDARIAGGESFNDMRQRFVPFIEQLVATSPNDANIVCIGHGALFICMLPLVLENIDARFALARSIGNTNYILAEKRNNGLICREWCGEKI